jgi:hypothetical protein
VAVATEGTAAARAGSPGTSAGALSSPSALYARYLTPRGQTASSHAQQKSSADAASYATPPPLSAGSALQARANSMDAVVGGGGARGAILAAAAGPRANRRSYGEGYSRAADARSRSKSPGGPHGQASPPRVQFSTPPAAVMRPGGAADGYSGRVQQHTPPGGSGASSGVSPVRGGESASRGAAAVGRGPGQLPGQQYVQQQNSPHTPYYTPHAPGRR